MDQGSIMMRYMMPCKERESSRQCWHGKTRSCGARIITTDLATIAAGEAPEAGRGVKSRETLAIGGRKLQIQ